MNNLSYRLSSGLKRNKKMKLMAIEGFKFYMTATKAMTLKARKGKAGGRG